jgi:type IV pilus assembly protein PilA
MRRVALTIVASALVFSSALAQKGKEPGDEVAKNEPSAVGSLRSLVTAEIYYAHAYSEIGFTCTLANFSPPAAGQKPSAKAAGVIDPPLTSGTKAGYHFTLTCPEKAKPQKTYRLSAVPITPGKSGKRAFCTDQTGTIKVSDDGKAETCFANGKPL